ncbi:MAG: transketolase [Alphaproteobacteria bacterium]|nr:transketolase [Alphaproteobacteria bacterium]
MTDSKTASATAAEMANAIRALAMDAVEAAGCGHPGMPMGMADVATVLFTEVLKVDPAAPHWPDRDRFVLSAGHGSMLHYALNHLIGYADMPMSEIRAFRQLGSATPGHPEYGHTLGVETTTGPLGQGLATAVGMALAERLLNARFGDELVDHRTYVIAGDGCLMEGISHEAIDLAGHLGLSRLIVLFDDNGISIDGPTSLATSMDQVKRFEAAGWRAERVDGHDPAAVAAALARARAETRRPSLIACRTTIGRGAPTRAGTAKAHGEALGAAEIAGARESLNWPWPPFEIPPHILAAWRQVGARGAEVRRAWEDRLKASPQALAFSRQINGEMGAEVAEALAAFKRAQIAAKPKLATRKASELALAAINAATPLTLGGSADLTHSNFTITAGMAPVRPDDFSGRYIHYGIREHGMAAAMNGLALHGGFIPYGGTFLTFADYARGAMRLSALMGLGVVYVMTHDSIGLGEDGPTHQPVEHLAMLRATPNMDVYRPADAVETAEAWELALASRDRPSVLVLSRQGLPTVRTGVEENLTARGAYVLRETAGPRDVTLLATGSEVEIALAAAAGLAEAGIAAAVVSMPCWERFEAQDPAYRAAVLGEAPRVAIEAAVRLGWDRWLGPKGAFVGMEGFGASAPAGQLYAHFAITPERVIAEAKALL